MSETKTKNLCTVPAADLTDSQYFIAEDGGELKRIPKAQVVLKKLENMLATDTENLAGGGEVTAQELLDALAEQVANKLLAKSQVVNNLLATVEGNPLDATQGKALKELIDTTNNNLSNSLQYVHTAKNPFDFNDVNTPAGFHRVNDSDSFKNPPLEIQNNATINYGNIFVCRSNKNSDTLSMSFYPCFDNTIFIKTANSASWESKGWLQLISKSDLLTQLLGNVKVTGEDARSSVELFSSLPGNTLYFFHCPGTKGIAAELGFSDVNNALCGFIYKASTWRGCGILIPMTGVVTDYNIFVGRLEAENKLKWVGIK